MEQRCATCAWWRPAAADAATGKCREVSPWTRTGPDGRKTDAYPTAGRDFSCEEHLASDEPAPGPAAGATDDELAVSFRMLA